MLGLPAIAMQQTVITLLDKLHVFDGAHANAFADSSVTLGLEHLSVNPFCHLNMAQRLS